MALCAWVQVKMTWLQQPPERSTYSAEQKVFGTRGGERAVGVLGRTVGGWRGSLYIFQKHRLSVKGGKMLVCGEKAGVDEMLAPRHCLRFQDKNPTPWVDGRTEVNTRQKRTLKQPSGLRPSERLDTNNSSLLDPGTAPPAAYRSRFIRRENTKHKWQVQEV